jgi:molybdopterin-guanine dinucleotide biosynthesis protein A
VLQLLVDWPGTGTVIPVVDGRFQYACARYGAAALDEGRAALRTGVASLRAIASADCDYLTADHWGEVTTARAFADVDTPDDWERLGLT